MPLIGLLAVAGWKSLPDGKLVRPAAYGLIALSIFIQFLAVTSDQSERMAALEAHWGSDYYARSALNAALSPIADRGVVFVHKMHRLQGFGVGLKNGDPSNFFKIQKPYVIFLPSSVTMQFEGRASRQKTLVLRYRYCFDFWWCYAGAMGIISRWMSFILGGIFLFLATGLCVIIRRAIQ
jgi:hypothetical protein